MKTLLKLPFIHLESSPIITAYEQTFAQAYDTQARSFAFWKGRVALFAILKALGVGPGDEVIVPGFTCVVVANAIRFTGAEPIYADINPDGYNIDPNLLEEAITPRTRAALIQHTFGIPGPLGACLEITRRRGIYLIEDCAHAQGSTWQGRPLGSFGDAAFFSSQWSKPYTTGLGGMAVTNNPDLANKLAQVASGFVQPGWTARLQLDAQYNLYRRFFSPRIYWQAQSMLQTLSRLGLFVGSSSESELEGKMPTDHTWRMAPAQQKAGLAHLRDLPRQLHQRRNLADYYDKELAGSGWPVCERPEGTVLLRYPLQVSNKEDLLEKARRAQVELGSWFETPLHPTPLAQHEHFGYRLGQNPHAERAARQVVNLPLHRWMTVDEAARVVRFVLAHASRPIEPAGERESAVVMS